MYTVLNVKLVVSVVVLLITGIVVTLVMTVVLVSVIGIVLTVDPVVMVADVTVRIELAGNYLAVHSQSHLGMWW